MAIIFDTATAGRERLKEPTKLHVYNSLDALLTSEIHDVIHGQLKALGEDSFEAMTYEFSRAMQAPVLSMMREGIRIDDYARGKLIDSLSKERTKLEGRLRKLIFEGLELTLDAEPWLKEFNHRSINPPTDSNPFGGDVQRLLYTVMGLPIVRAHNGKPSVDRDALERLSRYPTAKPFCGILLALRDIDKTLSDLKFELDPDGRIRTTLSVAGTNTGRMSSYTASSGKGRNLQNIPEEYRHIFVSDKGTKFAQLDLEQAESRLVGAIIFVLFGDSKYLDACESSDLHTEVAKLVWPHIKNRHDADQKYYRDFSYRFLCKRISHGSNYVGTPRTISAETTVPIKEVESFQERYFAAFPGIRKWHHWVSQVITTQGYLVSLMGRKRWFLGKPDEDSTLRDAVAYDPQGSIADLLNRGLFRLWYKSKIDKQNFPIKLLLQVHDSVLIEYPEDQDESVLIPRLINELQVPIKLCYMGQKRELLVPAAAEIGFSWGKKSNINPDGLIKFDGKNDNRKRQFDPSKSVLETAFT